MATRYDPETNFTLFYPTRLSDQPSHRVENAWYWHASGPTRT
jgi:hypothetical protein